MVTNYDKYIIPFFLIIAVIGASFFVPPFIAALLIPAVVIGVLLLGYPRNLMLLYLGMMGVYSLVQDVVPIQQVQYLDEIFGAALFAVFFGHLSYRRMSFQDAKKMGNIAKAMFGYILLSWLINRGSPRAALQSMATYFSFIPVYIIAIRYLQKDDFKKILVATIIFFWINYLLNIGWYIGINPLPLPRPDVVLIDSSVGTLGGCNYVAYFCAMMFFLLVSVFKSGMPLSKRLKFWMGLTLVALFGQLYLTFTNHAYILFAVALVPYLYLSGLWKRWWAWGGGLIVIVGVMFLYGSSEQLQQNFSIKYIQQRHESFERGAKGQLYQQLLVDNAKSDTQEWLIGVGPGNGMGAIGKDNSTPFALKMLLPFYQSTANQMVNTMQMTSISGNTTSGIFTFWGDFGLIGGSIFSSFYVWLLARCFKLRRTGRGFQPVIAEFLIGAVTMFLLVNIFIDIFAVEVFSIWIWIFAALMNLPDRDGEETLPNLKTTGFAAASEGASSRLSLRES